MTREEIEQLNEVEPYCFETDREEQWYKVGLQEGLRIADENPKSLWVSMKDKKPEEGVEVIAYHHKWVNEDFNPNGTRVGFLNGNGEFTSAYWWNYQDCYQTINSSICLEDKEFFKNLIDNTEPEFWMPIPKLPN